MARLSKQQEVARHNIADIARSALTVEQVGNGLLAALATAVPADEQKLFSVDPASLLYNRLIAANKEGKAAADYWLEHVYLSEAVPFGLTPPGMMAAHVIAVAFNDRLEQCWLVPEDAFQGMPQRRWRETYDETATPAGGGSMVHFSVRGQWIAGYHMARAERRHQIQRSEVAFLRGIAPIAARALLAALKREEALRSPRGQLPEASGALVLDSAGKVQLATPAAEAWLTQMRDGGLSEAGGVPVAIRSALAQYRAIGPASPPRDVLVPSSAGTVRVAVSRASDDCSWVVILSAESNGARLEIPRSWDLTNQERRIVRLLLRGLSNKQIALALVLSENTVESHVSRIYRKTGVTSRAGLLAHFVNPAVRGPAK